LNVRFSLSPVAPHPTFSRMLLLLTGMATGLWLLGAVPGNLWYGLSCLGAGIWLAPWLPVWPRSEATAEARPAESPQK